MSLFDNFKVLYDETQLNINNYFNTLKNLYSMLEDNKINHAFIGHTALILHFEKINRPVEDIDILIDRSQNEIFLKTFNKNNAIKPSPSFDINKRSFCELNNFKIDIWTTYNPMMKKHPNKLFYGSGFLEEEFMLKKQIDNSLFCYHKPQIIFNLKKSNNDMRDSIFETNYGYIR